MDPFGLCPKDAGGDGKTSDYGDCPQGSSGYWAYREASGEGSSLVNNVMGVWAVLNFDMRAQLPEGTLSGEFNLPIGPGRIAKLAGETGNFRHAIKMLGLNKNAASVELHAIKKHDDRRCTCAGYRRTDRKPDPIVEWPRPLSLRNSP